MKALLVISSFLWATLPVSVYITADDTALIHFGAALWSMLIYGFMANLERPYDPS